MRYDIFELLRENPYPGRGIVLGRSEDNCRTVMLYFIMGRSVNSRNRVFEKTEDGIRTRAFDPAKLTDPSLIIYRPVRILNGRTIVTNGDHTETIYEHYLDGRDFFSAMHTREFEPDAPNYTPRISGLIEVNGSYCLSILKTADGNPECCMRACFEYTQAIPGLGHFISTYKGDGDPLPSFVGEPIPIDICVAGGLEVFAKSVWNALNDENKVSLYARETVIATGDVDEVLYNKNV